MLESVVRCRALHASTDERPGASRALSSHDTSTLAPARRARLSRHRRVLPDRGPIRGGLAPQPPASGRDQSRHHAGLDRIVFDFRGSVPSRRTARYVARLIADPSGHTIPVAGRAILRLTFASAQAHTGSGHGTAPARLAFALPNVVTVVRSGDFEGVVSYGIGLTQRAPVHVFTLTRPSRVVIDVGTPFRTVYRRLYLFNERRFAANTPPFVTGVLRALPARTPATGLMDRLFAGPTSAETRAGLRLRASGATGFTGLSITGSVARIRLTGGCSSGGSTATIAQEVFPTLKQLPGVRYVKIYDPAGHTEHPAGARDSIPFCLEP